MLPAATPVARPPLVIVATAPLLDVQLTELVRFCWLPSLYVPVAVNCSVVPFATDAFTGVTASDTSAVVTVSVVEALIVPELACIVVLPVATPVANPVPLIVATTALLELHVTTPVKFCWLPSLYVPVAVNCSVAPFTIDGFAGVTASDTSATDVTLSPVEPPIEAELA